MLKRLPIKILYNRIRFCFCNTRLNSLILFHHDAHNPPIEIRREFAGQQLSEKQIRRVLDHAGFKTYPRPTGLSSDFVVELSKENGGMIYRKIGTTKKENILVRIMPGTRKENVVTATIEGSTVNGRWRQQTPYVIQRRGKEYLTRDGVWIKYNDPAITHIPIEIYEFTGW